MSTPTPNWVNVKDNGAVGDGVTDDTAAIQAVLTAAESNTLGTVVYFPAGTYMVSSLTYSSVYPIALRGDGPADWQNKAYFSNVQAISPATPTVPVHLIEIDGAAGCLIDGLGVLAAQTATSAYTNDYIGINLSDVYYVRMSRVFVYHNLNGNDFNTGIKTDAGVKNFMLDDYVCGANMYGYWMDGSIQVSIRNANVGTTQGAGGAGFYMENGAATLRLTNCQTDRGDRGIWVADGNFLFLNDVEINNYGLYGIELDMGGQVWANQVWISGVGTTGGFPPSAVTTGEGFNGIAYFTQCAFQGNSEHTVTLQGGQGYSFTDCTFGYADKDAADTWDELHIGEAVSVVTVTGCHFNVDPFYGIGASTPRSAIWIGTGASQIGVVNCACATSGYGAGRGRGGSLTIGLWTNNLGGW